VVEDPIGVYFVSPLSASEGAVASLPEQGTSSSLRFHRAVWAAFIRPLENEKRFLNLDNIGFTNSAEIPSGGNWREIEKRFILGVAPNAPVDGADLQSRIEEWANHADVPISKLLVGTAPSRETSRHLEQLLTIIDSIPASLLAEWSIPASVLKHLRNSR
jgi:hypothetical protein